MVDCEGISLGSSCAKLPHSHSAEISKTPPPGGPKNPGKMLALRIHMLDDNVTLFQVQAKALGRVLFEQVCKQLNLLEADYFGLEYQDHNGTRYWLDVEKPLSRQVGLSLVEPLLHFCVKFYTPDPAQLEEEYTRYLFCLQIKRDLAQGHIQCNDNTAALMASYIVQAECGDYMAEDYPDASYLSSYKFVQHQDRELEKKIMENHKKHAGQSPAEADLNLLETARRCELYGMKMHSVKDHEGVPLNLAVAHMGIVVFQGYTKIYTFSWAKIRKISFKRKKFLIKLHPDGYGYYKDTVEFFFETRNECKNLWKKCVENHGFFRCNAVKRVPRQRTRVLSRGSSFRYSGKTQKQMVEFVRENYVKRQNFQRNHPLSRSQSFRQSSSVHSSVATNVGGSISAHPLIPLGDTSIVSASCGSMVLAGVEGDSPSRTSPVMAGVGMDRTRTTLLNHFSPPLISPRHLITSPPAGLHISYKQYITTSSQTDIVDFVEQIEAEPESHTPIFTWHRSASCKELRKPQESIEIETKPPQPKYERNFIIAGSKTPSLDRTGVEPDSKVYSSSYPGTTSSLSTESADEIEPGGSVLVMDTGSSREFSQDDLSHDSYELLEREARSFIHSRSCSLGSSGEVLPDDEMFVIDDYKEDVEKRLGYVEPRYRDMGFNEFNEKCKMGFAKFRERERIDFNEFDSKDDAERYPVERTNSEPFVSDFWKVARQHRKLFHQKSFDYTPTDSIDTEERTQTSKSTADIPYTLHKRQQMNGTAPCYDCRSPVSPRKSPEKRVNIELERKRSTKNRSKLTKTKLDSDLNSQDSGLSLSLGTESVDDLIDQNVKNDVLTVKSTSKSNEEVSKIPRITNVKKDLLKITRSEDGPRTKGVLVKSKAFSADSDFRKTPSFERNPAVEVIKIDSQDGEGIVICSSDDKNISIDSSDPDVIIVEYKTSRRRAFQKRGSSDSRSSIEKRVSSSFDSQKSENDTTGPRKGKMKEWKSESSSSQDIQDRSDFRRERFSKEIKTSIEGKVVRESKEEKELKKQRSEEMERQKTQKLIKSKSASTERNPDKDKSPTQKDAKAEFEKTKANLIELKSVSYCTCDHDISKMTLKQSDKKVMDALVENKEEAEEVFENQIQKRTAPLEINVEIKNKNTNNVKENGKMINNQVTPINQNVGMNSSTLSSKSTVGSTKDGESDINEEDRSDDVFLEEREFKAANLLSNRNRGGVREIIIIDTEEEHKKIVGRKKKKSNEDIEISKKQELHVVVDVCKNNENLKLKESEISQNPELPKTDIGKRDEISRKQELSMVEVDQKEGGISRRQVLPDNSKINEILEIKGSEVSKQQESSIGKNDKKDEKLLTMPVEVAEEAVEVEELNQKEIVPPKNKKPNELTLKSETSENKPVSKVEVLDSATKTNKQDVAKQVPSPELVWKKFGELPPLVNKRERSPVLFARLGFSEGSAFSPTHAQSPASSRRAKSLDAPVVSLHRLPPITSFSSKDDTMDNDEGIELEEKSLRGIKPVGKTSVIEEEDASHLSPITREMPSSELTAVTPEPGDKQKSIPSPIVVDKVPTESVNTDDDTKSSPCTVAEISPDYNKSPQEKGPSCDTSEADQALPVAKKLHSRLLVDVDKLSNASDEQKVPESDVYDFDSPRKPSEAYDDDYENDVFECIASDKEVERIVSRDPMERRVLSAEQSPVRGPSPTPDNTIRKASLEVPGKRSSTSDSRKASDSSDILEGEGPEPLTERRPSTRQERLDSFKNTKSYSVEIWTSEETDAPGIPTVDIEDVDWGNDDDAFAPDPIEVLKDHMSPKEAISPDTTSQEKLYFKYDEPTIESNISGDEVFLECEKPICQISVTSYIDDKVEIVESPDIYSTPIEETQPLADLGEKVEDPSTIDLKMIPPKRSFDEDVSSSSSVKPERSTWKPFSLESSGSSSLEEGIFPPDDCSHFADEEEGSSNSAKEDYQGFGYSVVGAETLIGGYTGGVFGLSRTLSRISERSTTSEQERSDFEDDISTKPSSRSLSVEDESLMSSDRQPSLSSDPSINPEIEDRPLPPLPPEPLGFKIPPPLLNPEDEWPSPPNSSFETPVISNVEAYYMEMKPEEATKVVISRESRQYESSSDSDYENKTLQDDAPESSAIESTVKLAVKPKRPGNSSDTSLGVSDFSSSTSTVKLQYYSCTVKSDDSSLAEFGSSLSTEMLVSSRKNSDDSVCLRRRSYHALQRSFDDYDSPYSESDESSRQQRQRGYMNLPSPTSGGSGSQTPRKGTKQQEGRRKEERRPGGGKSIARSKCYSYYSLARSPPSDGSSSSLEMGEPPTTPNTIPRVSKRKRHVPPSKRRLRVSTELDIRDGHLISVSSPSVVACGKCHVRVEASRSQMSKQSSV